MTLIRITVLGLIATAALATAWGQQLSQPIQRPATTATPQKPAVAVQAQPPLQTAPAAVAPPTAVAVPLNPPVLQLPALWGWVDLHTHPMSNLAFGGKLFHGGVDVGSLLPAIQMPTDPQCRFDARATTVAEALSDDAPTLADPFQSKCGNAVRMAIAGVLQAANNAVVTREHAVGVPAPPVVPANTAVFSDWPRWNDVLHQKMFVDWIQRARDGGLRVMVGLSHNNRTIAEAVGPGAPITGVRDDKASSDLQISEIRRFVAAHPTLMAIALSSRDLYQIVQSGRIAVILGVEVDNLGDFNDLPVVSPAMVSEEVDRLIAQGVRYIFPIHLADNKFGDTAIYEAVFDAANYRETHSFWAVGCSAPQDLVGFHLLFSLPAGAEKLFPGGAQPPPAIYCPPGTGNINVRTRSASNQLVGLTSLGEQALKIMMQKGLIIDIDHMSNAAAEDALRIAALVPGGYPVNSGHSAIRTLANPDFSAESSRTPSQLQRIACLGGMFGLGTSAAKAYDWAGQYALAINTMNSAFTPTGCSNKSLGPGGAALGTDTNSFVRAPRPTMIELDPGQAPRMANIYPPFASDNPKLPFLQRSTMTGVTWNGTPWSVTWDYNFNGVAHYGMYADFVQDVRAAPASATQGMGGKGLVDSHLLLSADYFYHMWQKVEAQAHNVQ
jgi:microsomal dipeptidase-like Zn-dependent dipeptidase